LKQYVVIGGGIAGVNCVEGIRSVDAEAEITLLSAERFSNYSRPLISYYLEGKTDLERISYHGADFYGRNRCAVFHETRAETLDEASKTVTLSNGRTLSYDALCVAAGSAPFVPPFPGLESVSARFGFQTLADALALEKSVTPESRVLIIGGGFIGLKCAEGLTGRVHSVTVCDLASHVLSSILQPDCAGMVERNLEAHGVRLRMGDSAERFEGNAAYLKSGEKIQFDALVLAIGTRPNVALISQAGGAVNRGILVNDRCETSLPDVYAAGDCCETRDITSGKTGLLAILPNAAMQGYCAGVNMAGGTEIFDKGLRMNSISFFGQHIMTAGTYCSAEEGGDVYAELSDGHCKKLFSKDGFLTGFILIGDVERTGIYTSLIRERIPLDGIDFDAVKKEPSLLPFGREYRAAKLGGRAS